MKTKTLIEALLAASVLLAAVTGCAERGTISKSIDPGGDYSSGDSGASSDMETSENSSLETSDPSEKYVVKYYEKTVDSEGKVVNNTKRLNDLYLSAMDDNYLYLASNVSSDYFSLDRGDYSSYGELISSYNPDLEWGGTTTRKHIADVIFDSLVILYTESQDSLCAYMSERPGSK